MHDCVDAEARVGHAHRRAYRVLQDPEAIPDVAEAELQHPAPVRQQREVEAAVHPPHQQLWVKLVARGVAELPASRPTAEPEHIEAQLLTGHRQQVLIVDVVDDAGALQRSAAWTASA